MVQDGVVVKMEPNVAVCVAWIPCCWLVWHGTGSALVFRTRAESWHIFFDVAEICVTWWSHMEERDAAMRGRSCWTRRLVLQQRRSGCGRPRKIPSCRLDASWFLAWAKGAIGWQRQETLVEPVDATVWGVGVPEAGWHCQGLMCA